MRRITFSLFALFLMFHPKLARADIVNEFVQIQCNQDLNFLRVEGFNINGRVPYEYAKAHLKEIWEKYGMISIDEGLFNINVQEHRQDEKTFSTECALKKREGTSDTYKIIAQGYALNANPNGMCGGHRSFSLSIWRGENQLIDELSFEPSCKEPISLNYVTVIPHEGYMTLGGEKQRGDESATQSFSSIIWLDEPDRPLTNKVVYGDYEATY